MYVYNYPCNAAHTYIYIHTYIHTYISRLGTMKSVSVCMYVLCAIHARGQLKPAWPGVFKAYQHQTRVRSMHVCMCEYI